MTEEELDKAITNHYHSAHLDTVVCDTTTKGLRNIATSMSDTEIGVVEDFEEDEKGMTWNIRPTASRLPTRAESTKKIKIIPLDRGFKVKVGCQELAFTSQKKLINALTKYLADPYEVEKAWLEEGRL